MGLRDEESRKYGPFSHHRSRSSHNPTASQAGTFELDGFSYPKPVSWGFQKQRILVDNDYTVTGLQQWYAHQTEASQRFHMVTFDSPIERCAVCGEVVLIDQTQRECASEHGCGDRKCPLHDFFEGQTFDTGQHGQRKVTSERTTS